MAGSRDLDLIYSEVVAKSWSAREVPFGVYIDESHGGVVVETIPLLEAERDALRLIGIGGDRIVVDETAHPERR